MMASASSSFGGGGWRTAFLSLRDETLTTPSSPLPQLLHHLIFAHSHSLVVAASVVPPYEVTSDLAFLMDLVVKANASGDFDTRNIIPLCISTCQLVHDVCQNVSLQMSSSSSTLFLDSFASIVDLLLRLPAHKIRPLMQCLEILRRPSKIGRGKSIVPDNAYLLRFLLHIVESLHRDLMYAYRSSSASQMSSCLEFGSKQGSLFDVLAFAFDMLGETFSASDSSVQADIHLSAVEVLRKVMEVLASRSLLIEDNAMTRSYTSLLQCLHLVLKEHKSPVSDHVSSLVAALKIFLGYGLISRPQSQYSCARVAFKGKDRESTSSNAISDKQQKSICTPYRPPHLRKNVKQSKVQESCWLSDQETMIECPSSDSDFSDNDGSVKDSSGVRSSKVRVAAIVCLQDLCQADPELFTTHWMAFLPTNDVLKPRKLEPTLLTCLLFDPFVKVRIASASTLATMMDGPSCVFLQVAEYKECTKYGSFMPLSSSLGLILIQLHTGILHLIQHEKHSKVVVSAFKILMLLISCTPYSRLPGDLLPMVIKTLLAKIEGLQSKNDQAGLLGAAISGLTAVFSVSPASTQVKDMLSEEMVEGSNGGVLTTLLQYGENFTNANTCFEALQALRALSHNYPMLIPSCWERVSAIVHLLLRATISDAPPRTWKGPLQESMGIIGEKVLASCIKVLDEFLRGISGFKGTEDLFDDKLLETPFTLECIRTKKVSSAPSYELEDMEETKRPHGHQSGREQWSEAIKKHIPLVLQHSSAMVRNASITCFAGITSSVFLSLTEEEKNFITSSVIRAAIHDDAPQVRSAACRAIGVCSCFPEISRCAEIFERFIRAIENNSRDSSISVRITASWALANICDSLRHWTEDFPLHQFRESQRAAELIELLVESALRLTKDGDKVKSNAVRALGNISRSVYFRSPPNVRDKLMGWPVSSLGSNNNEVMHTISLKGSNLTISNAYRPYFGDSTWLERIVQAFLSCVTTGNVKVQWNVCHALSNLFSNETIQLQDMDWAPSVFSVLLLLLRDSSNFKIRIQAAAALAVPASPYEYGHSFPDVVQGVVHILESLGSEQGSTPSNFKYKIALERQLTSTMLHLLSLTSSSSHQPLTDFLFKKFCFLEEWLEELNASLTDSNPPVESQSQKKEMIAKAIRSLTRVYEARNNPGAAQKFDKLRGKLKCLDR